jgi:hypothetical protein
MTNRIAAAVLLWAAVISAAPPPDLPITRGQSPAEVRSRLGPPVRIGRQILFGRHVEQWGYDDPRPYHVEFSCIRGQDPFVCAILLLSPARP